MFLTEPGEKTRSANTSEKRKHKRKNKKRNVKLKLEKSPIKCRLRRRLQVLRRHGQVRILLRLLKVPVEPFGKFQDIESRRVLFITQKTI